MHYVLFQQKLTPVPLCTTHLIYLLYGIAASICATMHHPPYLSTLWHCCLYLCHYAPPTLFIYFMALLPLSVPLCTTHLIYLLYGIAASICATMHHPPYLSTLWHCCLYLCHYAPPTLFIYFMALLPLSVPLCTTLFIYFMALLVMQCCLYLCHYVPPYLSTLWLCL